MAARHCIIITFDGGEIVCIAAAHPNTIIRSEQIAITNKEYGYIVDGTSDMGVYFVPSVRLCDPCSAEYCRDKSHKSLCDLVAEYLNKNPL